MVQVLKGQKRHVATSEVDPNVIGYVSFVMARGSYDDWRRFHEKVHVTLRNSCMNSC